MNATFFRMMLADFAILDINMTISKRLNRIYYIICFRVAYRVNRFAIKIGNWIDILIKSHNILSILAW